MFSYDNKSVVTNSSVPTSVLNKRDNATCYHRVREAQAADMIRVGWIEGGKNVADLFTKTTLSNESKRKFEQFIFDDIVTPVSISGISWRGDNQVRRQTYTLSFCRLAGTGLVSPWRAILTISASGVGLRYCPGRFRGLSCYNCNKQPLLPFITTFHPLVLSSQPIINLHLLVRPTLLRLA